MRSLLICIAIAGALPAAADPSRLADGISPIARDAMDPEIVDGVRPRIFKLGNKDIEQLVAQPRKDVDFVMFKFIVDDTTSTQKGVLESWLSRGFNRILLTGFEMKLYAQFFGLEADYHSRRSIRLELMEHEVNTDCADIQGNIEFESLPEGSVILAARAGKPAAGRFMHGKTEVYFHSDLKGNDADRWLLNFYHWALDLDIPPSAAQLLNRRIADVREGQGTHDALTLRDGDVVKGVLRVGDQRLQTLDGPHSFKTKEIATIILEFTADKKDKVVLRDGKQYTGTLAAPDFKILLADGTSRLYPREKVKVVQYAVTAKSSANGKAPSDRAVPVASGTNGDTSR